MAFGSELSSIIANAGGIPITGSVDTFDDLPVASSNAGKYYIINTTTGIRFINRKKSGLWLSDGVAWNRLSDTTNVTKSGDDVSLFTNDAGYQVVSNEVIVNQASDLANIDSAKVYLINGKVDMGAQQIEVPAGGFFYKGLDYFVSSLFSSENNYTMFVNKAGENSGNVRATNVEHYLTGTNSQMFNLDNQENNGSVEFLSCNFGRFASATPSLGTISNYRQFRTDDLAFIRVSDGITFEGNWGGGFSVTTTILLAIPASATIFKKGTALVFAGSSTSNINAISVDDTATVFDFDESNFLLDWGFNLDGARFSLTSNPIPNILESSTKRYFRNSRGIQNTFIGGNWKLETEVTTVISTQNTAVKILGTTVYKELTHFSGDNSNEFVYLSDVNADFFANGFLIIDGPPNNDLRVEVRKWDDSASAYVILEDYSRRVSNVVGGLDLAYVQFGVSANLDINDRVELWIANESGTGNLELQEGSYMRLEQR